MLTNITHDDLKVMILADESINVTNRANEIVALTTGAGHVDSDIDSDSDINVDVDVDIDIQNDTDNTVVNDTPDFDFDSSSLTSSSPYSSSSSSASRRLKRSYTMLAPMKPLPSRQPKGRKCCGCPLLSCCLWMSCIMFSFLFCVTFVRFWISCIIFIVACW